MSTASQTVTFMFTDIEASTQRWDADGPAMSTALAAHDELMRTTISRHRGSVFKHTGDGVCAVFHSAIDAVRAAQEVQREVGLPVRVGLHTGEAESRGGDWYGATLNVVARIMDAGHGGQVLCSTVTASLLPTGIPLRALGEYRLKGLDRAETISQIGDGDFPPLRAASTMVSLPERRRSLVGREDLLERVDCALTTSRLVTLVGPGGVGKTSVAIEAARRATGRVDRTAFVDLTSVDGRDGVPVAVARALGLAVADLPAIRMAIGTGSTLLVMDNCEHVVDAAADIIDELVHAVGPRVHVVATSRESLELDGESVLFVLPLTDDQVMAELFLDRAAAAGAPAVQAEPARVMELCRRLDGLPLAIELAAARCTVFTVEQILGHLDQRLQLLSSGRRRGRERHRTLRETIDWSYELLDDDERDLYRRLAVFIDWFSIADAVAVAGGGSELEVLDRLEGLAARSLLVVSEVAGAAQYRYLESIRDHAWELLVADGRDEALMIVLVDHLARKLAALATQLWDGPDGDPLEEMGRLVTLQRHAVEWCINRGDVARAKRLMLPYAQILPSAHAPAFESAERLHRVGVDTEQLDAEVLMLHLVRMVYRRNFRGYHEVMPHVVGMLDLASVPPGMIAALFFLSAVAGDDELLERLPPAALRTDGGLGTYLQLWREQAPDLDRVLALTNTMPTRVGEACMLGYAASIAETQAPERVDEFSDRIIAMSPAGSTAWIGAWIRKAGVQFRNGAFTETLDYCRMVIDQARAVGELSLLAPATALQALVLWKLGSARDAARVRGAAPRQWSMYFQPEREEIDAWLADRFTQQELRALAREGRALELDELFAIAPAALAARETGQDPSGT